MENNTDLLQIKIEKAKMLLPEKSRKAIDAIDWKTIILGMGSKYNSDQLENLETETELLLSGLTEPQDFPHELETRMHLSREDVGRLIEELDRLIFKKIQKELERRLEESKTITNDQLPITNERERVITEEKKPEIIKKFEPMPPRDGLDRFPSRVWQEKEKVIKNEELIIKNEEKNDEEVPLPPYGISSKEQVVSSKVEESSMRNTEKEIPRNIIEEKLRGATTSDQTISDYSSKSSDPYREKP